MLTAYSCKYFLQKYKRCFNHLTLPASNFLESATLPGKRVIIRKFLANEIKFHTHTEIHGNISSTQP